MASRLQILLGLLLISIGGMIYLSFRPTSLLMFHTLDGMGLMIAVDWWRSLIAWQPSEFVVFSLPGGLWAAAYILLVNGLMEHRQALLRVAIASIIPLMGIVSELLQQMQLLPGTFDYTDLLCYAMPLTAFYLYEIIKKITIWQVFLTASTVSN